MGDPEEVLSVRELRNQVSEVLRRVRAGERFRVKVGREEVAELVPLPRKRRALPMSEYRAWRASGGGADSRMLEEVRHALGDTTDDIEIP